MRDRLRIAGYAAAFLLQAGILAGLVAERALLLQTGTEIRLAVVPVDPRDLFRGDYVVLSTPLARIRTDNLGGDDTFTAGQIVYLALARQDEGWRAVSVHAQRPAGPLVLRGRIVAPDAIADCASPCRAYRVEYGLESFFVPEGRGRELERLRSDERLEVDVAVSASGRAALKRLLLDGRMIYEADLF
jgi:uncharacterized membrane-anchored protein